MDKNALIICQYCNKEFTSKLSLLQHQKTVTNCLELQGKNTHVECDNCKKLYSIRSYKQHKIKCDIVSENIYKHFNKDLNKKEYKELEEKYKISETENKTLKNNNNKLKLEIEKLTDIYNNINVELIQSRATILLLREQNEKYEKRMFDMASRPSTNNTSNNKTVVINTNLPLTNDVLRQCVNTFTIDNARNIGGITKHLTTSLEEHITCTDPSRNIFKYMNEKDEEIVDKDLENLLPQYLSAIKDRNNFFYKEMEDYFKKNNASLDIQTDYHIFYGALNSIIAKNGHQNKFSEKCKQYMVRECKKQFLDKNKNKEKEITRKMTDEEIMTSVIELGGSVNDFIIKLLGDYNFDEETDEQFERRRHLEDLFREKKKEWRQQNI